MKKGVNNINEVFLQADSIDLEEGKAAYENYNTLLRNIATHYNVGFIPTVQAFVSLSPNGLCLYGGAVAETAPGSCYAARVLRRYTDEN